MRQNTTNSGAAIEQLFDYMPGRFSATALFPNNREAALGSLGFQTAWHLFNIEEDFFADYAWLEPDSFPLKPGSEVLALSIAYELDIFNFLKALISWNIEPLSIKRKGPLVICGGVLPLINPLPLSPFVDIFLIGDGELLIPEFARIYGESYLQGKNAVLQNTAKTPGFYVPALNTPNDVKPQIAKRKAVLHSSLISEAGHFGEMFLVEVGRGCPRKCRFCASSHIHKYEYHASSAILSVIEKYAPKGSSIGLIGSALSDYPYLTELVEQISRLGFRIGLSSLRPDVITFNLAQMMADSGVKTLTIAPEAGSLKLRKSIGKGISNKLLIKAVENAGKAGIQSLKLYFLIGLPGEKEEDIEGIVNLVREIITRFPRLNIELSVNAFIPKPGTPFKKEKFAGESYIKKTRNKLRKALPEISFTRRSVKLEFLQAALSQGGPDAGLAVLDSIKEGISFKDAVKRSYRNGKGGER